MTFTKTIDFLAGKSAGTKSRKQCIIVCVSVICLIMVVAGVSVGIFLALTPKPGRATDSYQEDPNRVNDGNKTFS